MMRSREGAQLIGQQLAQYRITDLLGVGGMGEVYRADDTRLGREVAIKVLPGEVAEDPERLARFEREARALAQLNHSNIAAIYDLVNESGSPFLVLELVEGETLDERIGRGPLPLREALEVAQQILEALAEAHENGILHRDLKPANVKIRPDGTVKVLDFGLAKPFLPEAESSLSAGLSHSPTLAFGTETQAGVLMGTAAYMSPEQARGQAVDRRADIWAFGCVLYEMLAGSKAFGGDTVSDTLASVLKEAPPREVLPERLPAAVHRLLARTLAKDAGQRLHDIVDARFELEEAMAGPDPAEEAVAAEMAPAGASRIPWAVAGVAAAVALVLALALALGPEDASLPAGPDSAARVVASILPPPGVNLVLQNGGLAISPDGTQLAFVGRDEEGAQALWVRPIDRDTARRLPGTESADGPFWSPDGRHLGFSADGSIKKIDLDLEFVEVLAEQENGSGGSWGSRGVIVFSLGWGQDLMSISDSGGDPPRTVARPQGGNAYLAPSFLPDGSHFVFHSRRYSSGAETGQVVLGSLDGSTPRVLFDSNSEALYAEPGYLVWWQGGNLRAQGFDTDRLELVGESQPLAASVRFDPRSARVIMTLSQTGQLIYQQGGAVAGNQLRWFDRTGNDLGAIGPTGSLYTPRLSPDGSRIALDISGETNQGDIWILDAERGSGRRFTSWSGDDSDPAWSPDGEELAFFTMKDGDLGKVYRQRVSGVGEAELTATLAGKQVEPESWSPDGRSLLFSSSSGQESVQTFVVSLEDGRTRSFLGTGFEEYNATFSPDGKWVAYATTETGDLEVYITDFPDAMRRIPVTSEGGRTPRWGPNGTELFYLVPQTDEIVAVPVTLGGSDPTFGRPEVLFRPEIKQHTDRQFDTVDGRRFLVNTELQTGAREPLTLVLNWSAGLK